MRWLAIALVAGCYSPTPPAGAACVEGLCPAGLVCSPATNTCEQTAMLPDGLMIDAPVDAAIDAPDDGMASPYMYRRLITIQATTGLPAGYTVRVPFANLATLVSQGKLRADFADLRVVGDGSLGERNRIVDGAPAQTAINFSLAQPIALNSTSTSYYVYYGRPNASAAPANGAMVFPLYDDFNAGIAAFWMQNDAPATSAGKLVLRAGRTDALTTNAATDNVPTTSAIELVATVIDPQSDPTVQMAGTFYYWFGYQRTGDFNATDPWIVWIARGKGAIKGEQKSPTGCDPTSCVGTDVAQNTAAHFYQIERDFAATRFYVDGTLSFTATVQNGTDYSPMLRNFMATSDLQIDWVRARVRVTTEPTITLGNEETL